MRALELRALGLRGAIALVAAMTLTMVLAVQSARAEVGPLPPPDIAPVECNGFTEEQLPSATTLFGICVEINLLEGQAKFGDVESAIEEPVTVRQVIGVNSDLSVSTVDEGAAGPPEFPDVEVPGGLVGALGLGGALPQELVDALEPVNGITAEIEPLGDLEQTPPDIFAFLAGEGLVTTATIPLRVKVNNLVLGESCYIGSEEDPITLSLPIQLSGGYFNADGTPFTDANESTGYARLDATDDTFSIPAAEDCGILGTGAALNDAGLSSLNVFDQTVNDSVGLPSPSGNNLLDFDGFFAIKGCSTGNPNVTPSYPPSDPRSCYFSG